MIGRDDVTARILAVDDYVTWDGFVADAVGWVGDARSLPGGLVDAICLAYVESAEFATVIDDALDGERAWR